MVQPSEIEIAAAYFNMWVANLRSTTTDNGDAFLANAIADGIQQAAESILAGDHKKWWARNEILESNDVPRSLSRPPSGPHGPSRARMLSPSLDS